MIKTILITFAVLIITQAAVSADKMSIVPVLLILSFRDIKLHFNHQYILVILIHHLQTENYIMSLSNQLTKQITQILSLFGLMEDLDARQC